MAEVQEPNAAEEDAEPSAEEIARAGKIGRVVVVLGLLFVAGLSWFLWQLYSSEEKSETKKDHNTVAPVAPTNTSRAAPIISWTEAAVERGIDFVHHNGATGRKLLPETMGSGAVFFDFDNDDDPDLFFVNSAPWPEDESSAGVHTQALYENVGGRFENITEGSGLADTFYGMGAASADVDGDGNLDLLVTAVGRNRLYLGNGKGQFREVGAAWGLPESDGDRWSTSAAFLDVDRDGDPDLIVANYVRWNAEIDLAQGFQLTGLGRAYGPPKSFRGEVVQYFRNDGERFSDETELSGFQVLNRATSVPVAKALGVCVTDWNLDGWPDVVVANDTVRNFAFENQQNGTFREAGSEIGVAFDSGGNARGAMGIDAAHWANDQRLAVAVGNFAQESTAFYVNEDPEFPTFNDLGAGVGIGALTRDSLTFGVAFLDYDLDGRLDFAAANGHVEPDIHRVLESQDHAQPLELFWNSGPTNSWKLIELDADQCGEALFAPFVGRSLISADVDGDGDLDLLGTSNAGRPKLFVNGQTENRSLRLDLRSGPNNRIALGARVTVESAQGQQTRYLNAGHGYLGQSELVMTFGLGKDTKSGPITILWPDGTKTRLDSLGAGRHRLSQP